MNTSSQSLVKKHRGTGDEQGGTKVEPAGGTETNKQQRQQQAYVSPPGASDGVKRDPNQGKKLMILRGSVRFHSTDYDPRVTPNRDGRAF